MEEILKKALSRIRADDELKKKTAEFVLSADSTVVSLNAASRKKTVFGKKLVAAACIAAVLCALPIGAYAYYKTPTSYVSVDINPSVELGINAFGKVVSVKAYNTDGETVLVGLSLINTNVESAVRLIVKSASQNGFIKDDGSSFISVTAETNNDKKAEKLKDEAEAGAEDAIKSEDDAATIQTDTIALDRRAEAIALGITPGKLNLIQKLQELDPSIETEDYRYTSVNEIQKKFTELKKEQNSISDHDEATAATPSGPNTSPSDSQPSVSPTGGETNPSHSNDNNNNGSGSSKHDDESATNGIDADSDPANTHAPNQNGNASHNKDDKDGKDDKNGKDDMNGN